MALEGADINLHFMLGPPKMGPGAENKVCREKYAHFSEENGGPQKYARRAQMALSTPIHGQGEALSTLAGVQAAAAPPRAALGAAPNQKIRYIQVCFWRVCHAVGTRPGELLYSVV